MGTGKVYLVMLLTVWQFVALDLIFMRWQDYKLERSRKKKEQEEVKSQLSIRQIMHSSAPSPLGEQETSGSFSKSHRTSEEQADNYQKLLG